MCGSIFTAKRRKYPAGNDIFELDRHFGTFFRLDPHSGRRLIESLNRPLLARRRQREVIVNLRLALALAAAVTILSPATAGAWIYKAVPAATNEPFASTSIDAPEIPLAEQWRSVWAEIQSDITALSQCGMQPGRCSSAASIRFGKILESARGRDGLIKLAIINGGVNAAIRYAGIQQARVEYPWSSAAAIFTTRRGS